MLTKCRLQRGRGQEWREGSLICCFVHVGVLPRGVPTGLSKLRITPGILQAFFFFFFLNGHFSVPLLCLLINYLLPEGREMATDGFWKQRMVPWGQHGKGTKGADVGTPQITASVSASCPPRGMWAEKLCFGFSQALKVRRFWCTLVPITKEFE